MKNSTSIRTVAPGVPSRVLEHPESYMEIINQTRFEKLKKQIAYCFDNEYYAPRFRAAGVDDPRAIQSLADFRALPAFLTKAEHRETQSQSLEKYGHPFGLHLCAPLEEVIHVAGTSGTTGLPTWYLFTRKDLELTYLVFGRLFALSGIRPGDTVLHLYGLSLWLAGTTVIQALEAYGARPIPLGAEAGVSKALQFVKMCRPRVLVGTPSIISYMIDRAPEVLGCELNTMGIEIIVAGGEPGLAIPAYRKRIQEGTGARVFDMSGAAWLNMALACDGPVHTGQHLLSEDYCFRYDLVDPQTRKPLELVDGAIGEAIHTTLEYQAAPAFRYATGDMLHLHVGECPQCGQYGARFHFIGRADDLMNIAGVKVFPAAVKEVVESFSPALSGLMQIVLDRPPPQVIPPLRLQAEASPGLPPADWEALAKKVEERIHLMLKIRSSVMVIAHGTLERSNLKTKLIRIEAEAIS